MPLCDVGMRAVVNTGLPELEARPDNRAVGWQVIQAEAGVMYRMNGKHSRLSRIQFPKSASVVADLICC